MTEQIKMYEMEMIFFGSIGLKEINNLLHQCGSDDSLQIQNAVEIKVTQTLPKIPDMEYLNKVAQILKENYETKNYNLTECHFAGYKYIREVEMDFRERGRKINE